MWVVEASFEIKKWNRVQSDSSLQLRKYSKGYSQRIHRGSTPNSTKLILREVCGKKAYCLNAHRIEKSKVFL